jgi:hypothetical protein
MLEQMKLEIHEEEENSQICLAGRGRDGNCDIARLDNLSDVDSAIDNEDTVRRRKPS